MLNKQNKFFQIKKKNLIDSLLISKCSFAHDLHNKVLPDI